MLKEATISERKIVNAFIELLEESSLEQISITDIIKKANLSRPIKNMIIATAKNIIRTITVLSCKNVLVILSTEAPHRPIAVTPVPTVNIEIRLTIHQSIAPNA